MKLVGYIACLAALALTAATAGCGNTPCKMDTECPLPQVCVAGSCVARSMDGTVFDTTMDSVITDTPTEGDVPVETDVVEDPIEEEVVGPCAPTFLTNARTIFGTMSTSAGAMNDPDRPIILSVPTASTNELWALSRIMSEADSPKFALRKINPASASLAASAISSPLGNLSPMSREHALTPVGQNLALVFQDKAGYNGYQMMYMILANPYTTPILHQGFTGSETLSSEPAAASNGTDLMAVWRMDNGAGFSTLQFGRIDGTGAQVGTGAVAGDNTTNMGQPALIFNGTGYGLAYVVHIGAGADQVHFLELNADGSQVAGSGLSWTVTEATSIISLNSNNTPPDPSCPALAWSGSEYLLAFEEVSVTEAVSDPSHLHTKVIAPGGAVVLHEQIIGDDVADALSLTVTGRQDGMMDAAFDGDRFGLVWVHEDSVEGARVIFMQIATDGTLVRSANSPHILNPSSQHSFNPSIAWLETATQRYYGFIWNEFSSATAVHVTYGLSFGCVIE